MRTDITPGQTSDYLGFDLVMDDNLPEPRVLLADRGYDADRIRKSMNERDIMTQIPMRKTRKMRVGSTPDTTKPQRTTSSSSTSLQFNCGCVICQHDLNVTHPKTHHESNKLRTCGTMRFRKDRFHLCIDRCHRSLPQLSDLCVGQPLRDHID